DVPADKLRKRLVRQDQLDAQLADLGDCGLDVRPDESLELVEENVGRRTFRRGKRTGCRQDLVEHQAANGVRYLIGNAVSGKQVQENDFSCPHETAEIKVVLRRAEHI